MTGIGHVPIEVCDGRAQAYQAEVTAFGERRFKRGHARAGASGYVEGDRDGQTVTLFTSVPDRRITITRG